MTRWSKLTWRWRGGLAVLFGSCAILLGPGCSPSPIDEAAIATRDVQPDRDRLAVIYIENATDPGDTDRLGRMMTGLLMAELARWPDLDVVEPQRVYDIAAPLGGIASGDRQRASKIAQRLALDKMLVGELRSGTTLTVAVEVVDVDSGEVLATHQEQNRRAGELFAVATALGRKVSESLLTAPAEIEASPPLTLELTSSVSAYRYYVTGQDLLHKHDFVGAVTAFSEAVAIDPDFALAHHRLGISAAWHGDDATAVSASERALELAADVSPLRRNLFAATALYHRGRYSEAMPRIEALLVENPEDKEALYLLSEMYLHSGVDTYLTRATETMLILDSLDPSFGLLRNHLGLALALQGRWQEAESYLDRWIAEDPEKISLRHVALGIGGRLDEVPHLEAPVTRVNVNYGMALAMLQGRWPYVEQLVAEEAGEGYQRSWRLRSRGALLTYLGKFEAAEEAYRGATLKRAAPEHEGIQNGLPSSAYLCLAELAELRGDLTAARRQAADAIKVQPSLLASRYFAGRLAARDGDLDASEEHLAVLRRLSTASHGTQAVLFEQALEAEILLAEGRAAQAREKYQSVVSSRALLHDFYAAASSSGAVFRDGLARTCRALWDQSCESEALHGLLNSGFERVDHPVLYVRALFRLGELHLEAGEQKSAEDYFRRVLDHWGTADWRLAEVEQARESLDRR